MKITRFGLILRRLLAASYDWLLVIAMIIVAGLPLPLFPESWLISLPGRMLILSGMLLIVYLYFGLSWTRGGQTVGSRAWRLKLVKRPDGGDLGWHDATVRMLTAIPSWGLAMAGIVWLLIDRDQLAWHDRWSASEFRLQAKRNKSRTANPESVGIIAPIKGTMSYTSTR